MDSLPDVASGDGRFRSNYGPTPAVSKTVGYDPKPKLVTLCVKLVKIGAKVVRHGRYATFQMAEAAVPRDLFQEVLRMIDGLRRSPPVPA